MEENGSKSEVAVPASQKRRAPWPLIILTALFIIVPFLTWYGTWFGRRLSDEQIATYLADEKNPRHIQHALSQVADRIERHDASAKKFYPQVVTLGKSPTGEIRKTAAWVMGQDNTANEFHQALIAMLTDREPLVRRNAALQLVRFGDASGKAELRAMLQSFEAKSPIAGTVVSILPQGSRIGAGALLARIRDASNVVQEFRSPVDGVIGMHAAKEGEAISMGQTVVLLTPDQATVIGALRAFAYVGVREDLPLIETFSQATTTSDAEINQQARLTVRAIESRRAPTEQ